MLVEAAGETLTGNSSLDLVLGTAEPPFRTLILEASVPHWFNVEIVARLAPGREVLLEDLKSLPFVRSHAQGYAFHDDVRADLRLALIRDDPERVREISRELFVAIGENDANQDEVTPEGIYLALAFDEEHALPNLDKAIESARSGGQLNVTDTLVHLAEEQMPLLTEYGQEMIRYYRGLLAMDMRAWEMGAAVFASIKLTRLSAHFATRSQLNWGYCIEKSGHWRESRDHYEALLKGIRGVEITESTRATLHERLAEVYLVLRNLKRAERHGKQGLAVNQKLQNRLGEAVSLHILGVIREKLHDLSTASSLLHASLELFRSLGRQQEESRVWNDLGAISLTAANPARAREGFEQAQKLKVVLGDNYGLAFVYANLGKLAIAESGDFERAESYYTSSLALFRQFRDRLNSARILRNVALVHELQGHSSEAAEQMSEALSTLPDDSPLAGLYQRGLERLQRLASKRHE